MGIPGLNSSIGSTFAERPRQIVRRVGFALALLLLTSCGHPTPPPNVALSIQSDGDFMAFTPDSLTVVTGAHVTLTFHHAGAILSQAHDWVLARPGSMAALLAESDAAARASGGGGESKSFIKPGDPRIIAITPLIKKGETTSVEFTAPAPGDYPFFCSTPGHAEDMQGVLHVTSR